MDIIKPKPSFTTKPQGYNARITTTQKQVTHSSFLNRLTHLGSKSFSITCFSQDFVLVSSFKDEVMHIW